MIPSVSAALGRRLPFGLALVDRRKPAAEQDLPAQLQLFGGLVAGVDAASLPQLLELALVKVEPLGLADDAVRREAQPLEIFADGLVELRRRPLPVGIVEPQNEGTTELAGEQEVVQRGADIADVKPPRRRRGETRNHGHRGSCTFGAVWKKLLIG